MFGLFGSGAPDLSQVTASPNMDMGLLGSQGPMTSMTANFTMPAQPDFMGAMSALGGMGGEQQQPMMPPAPGPQLQAGGEQFAMPYQYTPWQLQPTAQRLGGLLGGGYGTV